MESNNVSQRMFGYLLINIMSNSHYFYLVKSTTNYVTAYRELRKEKDNLKLSEMYVLMANQNMLFINEKQLDITR